MTQHHEQADPLHVPKKNQLLSCPCCGGKAEMFKGNIIKNDYHINCTECNLTMSSCVYNGTAEEYSHYMTAKQMFTAWNKRSV